MKHAVRILAFFLTFGLGFLFAQISLVELSSSQEPTPVAGAHGVSIGRGADTTGRLEVRYAGWTISGAPGTARLTFLVTNGTQETLTYRSHAPNSPFPTVTLNGEEVHMFKCGTGMQTFELAPGDSVDFQVGPYDFRRDIPFTGRDTATVGYYFKFPNEEDFRLYTSATFEIPVQFTDASEEIRKARD